MLGIAFPEGQSELRDRFFGQIPGGRAVVDDPRLEVRVVGPVGRWGAGGCHWGRPFSVSTRPATWRDVSDDLGAAGVGLDGDDWIVFTDSLAIHPLYVRALGGSLFFANRLAPLTTLPGALTMNPDAWACIIVLAGAIGRDTPFAEIERLPAASGLKIGRDAAVPVSYLPRWVEVSDTCPRVSVSDVAEAIRAAMPQRTFRRLPAVTLSGGWDSRMIAGILVDAGGRRPRAWTAALDDGVDLDTQFAPAVASTLGMEHRIVRQDPTGWPERATEVRRRVEFGTWLHHWLIPLVKAMHSAEREVVDGIAGDVLFKGLYVGNEVLDLPDPESRVRSVFGVYGGDAGRLANRVRSEVAHELVAVAWSRWRDISRPFDGHLNHVDLTKLHARTSPAIASSPLQLFGPELDVWLPFLHPTVMQLGLSIDPRRKADKNFAKPLLNAVAPSVASLPSTSDPRPPPIRGPRVHDRQEALRWMADLVLGSELPVSVLEPNFRRRIEDRSDTVPSDFTSVRVLEQLSLIAQWEASHPAVLVDVDAWG